MRRYEFQLTVAGASLVLAGAMFVNGAAMADSGTCSTTQPDGFEGPPTTTVKVVPEYCDGWTSGNAAQECVTNLGYDFGLKIDNWDNSIDGTYACEPGEGENAAESCAFEEGFENLITISNNDGQSNDGPSFDWASSPFALGAVVVKGGPNANVFTYAPPESADTDLYAPLAANGTGQRDISHASFCWNRQDGGDVCYQEETAWAVGKPYNKNGKGNWAMYVEYNGAQKTVDLRAAGGDGMGLEAGTVTLSAPQDGYVLITVNLENTLIFYYDLNDDEEDNNLKVEDYATAPKGNARPGRFEHKTFIDVGSPTGSISVPVNNFYGIHLDVAHEVSCDSNGLN